MRLAIAVPASVLTVEQTLQLKTLKVGQIVRYAAVFRVREIHVYVDRADSWRDAELFKTIAEYMYVAPYLRKQVFPPNVPQLRYAGLLPPLQLPTHGVGGPREGEVRQALVKGRRGLRVWLDAGLGEEVEAELPRGIDVHRGDIIHVRIKSLEPEIEVEVVDPDEAGVYSGYSVELHSDFTRLLKVLRSRGCSLIATSRYGRIVSQVLNEFTELLERECAALLFGAPEKGLYDIASEAGLDLEKSVDIVVNTIPEQGVATVRTEEAIAATLAVTRLALAMKRRAG